MPRTTVDELEYALGVVRAKLALTSEGKPDWHGERPERLLLRLKQEVLEVEHDLAWNEGKGVPAEAADVAALALMLILTTKRSAERGAA